jgi:hypothetical protein
VKSDTFTIRSLFALVTCVAFLLALLVPAVNAAREAARRMSCTNNLRQIQLAVCNYESTHRVLPPAFGISNGLSWTIKIQPYIEASSLYNSVSQAAGPFHARGKNDPFGLIKLYPYHCPAADTEKMELGSPHDVSQLDLVPPAPGRAPYTIHYYGISGPLGKMPHASQEYPVASPLLHEGAPVAGSGVFQWNTPVRLSSITDGTAFTFCLGEMSWSSKKYGTLYRSWLNGGTDGSFVVGCRNIARPINAHKQGPVLTPFNNMPMGSEHRRGTQFAMMDGNVVFLAQDIDFKVYQALASRNGNESLTDTDGQLPSTNEPFNIADLKLEVD